MRDGISNRSARRALLVTTLGMVLGLFATGSFARQSDEPLSPRIANYEMDILLDKKERSLEGDETLTWTNTTSQPAGDLHFHLYYNAWRNNKSSFFRGYRYRDFNLSGYRKDEWAYCDIRKIILLEDEGRERRDVTGLLEYIQPNDGNPHDRTVMRVPLEQPVGPGETIRVQIQWTSKVPRTFRRTGVRGDTYFLAQWFPKIGVFEESGWNCHQFTGTEFFADFGTYDVRLTVPADWVVGATGKRESPPTPNDDGTVTHRFVQHDVHDFAWTTSPDYIVDEQEFTAEGLPSVRMRLLLQPDHKAKKQRYFEATAHTLKHFGQWFGPYPYDHVTIVDPAFRSGSGGMEYPTFFTGGTRWLSPASMLSPEGVTVHECGHQWWYGIVANNEFEHAWLDEGLNTYSERRVRHEVYPPSKMTRRYFDGIVPVVFHDLPATFRLDSADRYRGFESTLKRDSMATDSWKIGPGAYGRLSYDKPALMLRTLENFLGWEAMQKVFSTYYDRWKFKHPKPQDFFDVVDEVTGQDMGWFFEAAYYGSGLFDYGVDSVKSQRTDKVRGLVEEDGELVPAPKTGRTRESEYESSVVVRRWGNATFPVEVRVTFDDGEQRIENWNGKSRWTRFDYTRPSRVARVEVDPDRRLVLDVNSVNNTWVRESERRQASLKWGVRWTLWLQNLLEQMAFFS